MWLPKAHVEAPVVGSIYLAGILLKLGGFGVIKLKNGLLFPSTAGLVILRVRAWGLFYTRGLCIQLVDTKVLIAFSSVSHIGVGLIAGLRGTGLGLSAMLIVLVAHGLRSSVIFYQRFLFYQKVNSRSLLLSKRGAFVGGM